MTIVFATLLLVAPAPAGKDIAVFGTGQHSCAVAFSPASQSASFAWIMGYMTGRNHSEGRTVGWSTDGWGIVAEIKLVCAEHPSLPLYEATEQVFGRLKSSAR